MSVVTVGTLDTLVIHLALDVRTKDIDFIVDLTVNMIGGSLHFRRPRLGDFGQKMVKKTITRMVPRVHHRPACMALGAGLYLGNIGGINIGQGIIGHPYPPLA